MKYIKTPLHHVRGEGEGYPVLFEADGMGLCSIQGTNQNHMDLVAFEMERAINAHDMLLDACKLSTEYIQHIHRCSQCQTGRYCEDGTKLWAASGDARDRAIAQAEGAEEQ